MDPDAWLAMDETERIRLVEDYHRRARISLPKAEAHAILHVAVENQIAEGDDLPVRRAAERLMAEGLDRHDAIHAIGRVLAGHMSGLMREAETRPDGVELERDPNAAYFAELETLTAEAWRRSG